ncbi:MAG: addiction module protein [Alphaproteobacteria bacterium]|nr:addiction module protein [Alphaproteobacteria bacterium]MBV8413386.1 addiction module protein [Alphaproteobacteria bacterium]
MPIPDLDLTSLSIEERLRLIDALWESVEQSAAKGGAEAARAVEQWADPTDIDPDFLAELEREADEIEKDPSKGIPWEVLLAELRQKRG